MPSPLDERAQSGPDVTMLVDLSKNLITESVLETLLSLAREAEGGGIPQ